MLSEQDKEYVTEVLIKYLAQRGAPRAELVTPFLDTTFAIDLGQGGVRELASEAIRLCIRDGWNNNPVWMERLLDHFSLRTVDGRVNEIWERSKFPPPPSANPLSMNVINGTTIFLNRRAFRTKLDHLETAHSNNQPIFYVSGGVQHGKSYSTNYIDHFSNVKPFIVCKSVFEAELGTVTGAADVAADLVTLMGKSADTIPPLDTNMKLYTRKLANWMLNQAVSLNGYNCWIVLDNFQGDSLRADTANFIVELSEAVTNGIFKTKCRLVLIGFDASKLMVHPGKIAGDTVTLCTGADITAAIKEILDRAIVQVNHINVENLICTGIPTGLTRMEVINIRLQGLLDAVNGLNDILSGSPAINYGQVLLEILKGLENDKSGLAELQRRLEVMRTTLLNL
jgi:hypothetical protein